MKKSDVTKQKIMASAWYLFTTEGYQLTTTRQIAQHANVATGTVFSHFPSKLDMLKEAMFEQLEQILCEASKTDEQHTARLKLRHYSTYLYAFYLENREFSKELLTGLIWQQSYFADQLQAFKHQLFAEQEFDAIKADIMVDCYFMTLVQGLNDPHSTADQLVRRLSSKLKYIQQ
ncbi:TetR/AcrR family transcriptional regulator [Pseudoalteromonas sp. T1lg65]|uniref:TetR/AcrR family transcriptional regulator n=1 Tax=Pseudoalteromonas sp. T1lg65 TaxID=2077101 RepID=UPI003F79E582